MAKRWQEHRRLLGQGKHHSPKLQKAWNEFGEGAFRFELLLVCAPARAPLLMYEAITLRHYDSADHGYNVAKKPGSRLGVPQRPEVVARMSASIRAVWATRVHPNKGRKHTEEHKRRMSEMMRGKTQPPWTEEQRAKYLESRKSPAFRAKLSAALKGNQNCLGRVVSPEMREQISAAQRGRSRPSPSPEVRIRRAESLRKTWANKRAAKAAGASQ